MEGGVEEFDVVGYVPLDWKFNSSHIVKKSLANGSSFV
jgi:hypothetical protein